MTRLFLLLVGLVMSAFGLAQQPKASLGSTLTMGSHRVGFEQKWLFDYGRSYQMKLPNGKFYGPAKSPRPILLNLWYPASVNAKQKPMPHGRYLEFTKGYPEIKDWLEAYAAYNREVVCTEATGVAEKKLNPTQKAAFQKFLEHSTNSIADARPQKGKFPLVIYHAGYGSSIEDNTEFCEFLASYGYVVASSSYVSRDGDSFNIDAYTGSAGDINFLTAYLKQRPNVDWQHVGLIGHSGGAHTALKYRAVLGGAADAIVSLDTTEDYYSLADPRWTFIKHDVLPNLFRMQGPILMVANPFAFFEMADKFKSADRHYFTLELGHNEFIAQGVQKLRVSQILAEPAKRGEIEKESRRVENNYRYLCEFLRGYFDATLKAKPDLLSKLKKQYSATPIGGTLPHVEAVPVGVTTPSDFDIAKGGIPTPRQMRPLLTKIGGAKTAELLKAVYSKSAPAPIFDPIFAYALEFDLFKQNRPDDAKALHTAYVSLGVKPASMFISQAWFGDLSKNYTFAEEVLNMLLTLEPDHEEGKKQLEEIRKKMKS